MSCKQRFHEPASHSLIDTLWTIIIRRDIKNGFSGAATSVAQLCVQLDIDSEPQSFSSDALQSTGIT
ncbi:hypothetical protein AOXY_G3501 [Acipenser oxyrinchus oxyrinchus]|uniref:Uncharacterized protein n=1 Tax=Acipenser oxyrinchus oxyrinchus TaxID=40147 RepID=A0AAD8GFL7_ACIOX|nr:hypothetical protein AOXY_G3501 [Acipenser oxyrinchus oxyrinchus]